MANVIAIDGPGSSGKTTIGKLLANKIDYQFIDTGLIYRVFAAYALNNKLSLSNDDELEAVLRNIHIEFTKKDEEFRIVADGVDITDKLHHPSITAVVPEIAAKKNIRAIANSIQHQIGESINTVMAGRDIGTEIFPNAMLKFYITASPKVRAHRRFLQLQESGIPTTEEEILEQINERDKEDSERPVSPLRKPKDAIEIDTSDLTLEASVDKLLEYFKSKESKV